MESLQVIEKEKQSLEVSNKELAEVKDQLEEKKIEKNELILRREVSLCLFSLFFPIAICDPTACA